MPSTDFVSIAELFRGDQDDQRTAVAIEEMAEAVAPLVKTFGPEAGLSAILSALYAIASATGLQRPVADAIIKMAWQLYMDTRTRETEERDDRTSGPNPGPSEAG